MSCDFSISGRPVGPAHPAYIIAELSANHGQDIARALELVDAAAECGADAVKLQTYTPDTITIASSRPEFRIGKGTIWEGRTLHDLYGEAYTPWEWHEQIMSRAGEKGLHCFSSPFDFSAVDFLESLNSCAYKIASFELVDIPLIEKAAGTGKPLIMSTGMASVEEINDAVSAARRAGCKELALLKCTSAYPTPPSDMNLRTISDLTERFGVIAGLSDHTLGTTVPVAAVAVGASIIEKHFTMSRSEPGPDSAFSLEPGEFKRMVEDVREAEQALGRVNYEPTEREAASRIFRRSLYVVKALKAGEPFSAENVKSIRPAVGLPPKHYASTLGRRAACDIEAGVPLEYTMIDPPLSKGE